MTKLCRQAGIGVQKDIVASSLVIQESCADHWTFAELSNDAVMGSIVEVIPKQAAQNMRHRIEINQSKFI